MHCAVSMACFVGNDLPLSASLDDNVSTSDSLARVAAVVLRACCTSLSKPG